MKFLILMPYFNRPKFVRNALGSLLDSHKHHADWELTFCDDGSVFPGRPIVEEMMVDHLDRITIIETRRTVEQKIEEGITIGSHANAAIEASDADVGITLCDDDALCPTYLRDLAGFFETNPEILHCYSKVHTFNPLYQQPSAVNNLENRYNRWKGEVEPAGRLDASQVAWRLDCHRKYGARFPESTTGVEGRPWTKDADRSFFEELAKRCGPSRPTGLVSQYKAIHDFQLLWHKNVGPDELRNYDKICRELAGVVF